MEIDSRRLFAAARAYSVFGDCRNVLARSSACSTSRRFGR